MKLEDCPNEVCGGYVGKMGRRTYFACPRDGVCCPLLPARDETPPTLFPEEAA